MDELCAVATLSGMALSEADSQQTFKALRSQRGNFVSPPNIGGTATAIVLTPSPAFGSLSDLIGVPLRFLAVATNTGAQTANVNGLGAVSITRQSGGALAARDIIQGAPIEIMYDGTAFRLCHPGAQEYALNIPAATLFVRTDGNDANDGSANTAGAAFATINAAIAAASQRFSLAGRSLVIQLGNTGTYAPMLVQGVAGNITIVGNVSAPGSYIISGVVPAFISGANVLLQGLTLSNSATTNSSLEAAYGGFVTLDRVVLTGVASSNTATAHLLSTAGGSITIAGAVTISSSHGAAFSARGGVITIQSGTTVTFSGGPAFALATAAARGSGSAIYAQGSTLTGAATGTRYSVVVNGSIDVNGAGANFFPGSVAGVASTGGQYF
jgi:hypothetical protein